MANTPEIVIMTDAEVDRYAADKDEGPGALLTDKGPLPLEALDVQARLEGLFAEVVLTQVFVNTHAEPLEATYIFPLPDRAAVTQFRLEAAGRVVEGVLKERAEARREFEEALQAGHRAAITEEERPGVFTMRVGNLPAGESATVRLTMVGPMIYDSGEVTFRFPLVVAPRYIPGNPLDGRSVGDGAAVDTDAVPDASRITPPVLLPGYPNPVRFSMAVHAVSAGLPIRDFRASLHAVVSEQLPDGTTRIVVQPGERLNRDFILRYLVAEEKVQTSLSLAPDATGDEGTFVLTVVPPEPGNPQSAVRGPLARSVVFVLDRSGSMDGWKMVAARRALGRMIDSLTERDRFTVLAFDEELEAPAFCGGTLVNASDRHRFGVIEWLARIDARGSTELALPLEHALTLLAAESQSERVLVLLTDGQVGNEDQILQALAQHMKGIRIFTLGIDRAVNEAFLRRLAALGGGSCDVVESEDRLDEVMTKVQRRIGTPVLTGLQLDIGAKAGSFGYVGKAANFGAGAMQIQADSLVPARLPDLFPGTPLTVLGRYCGAAQGSAVLRAEDDAGRPIVQTIEARVSAGKALAPIWVRGRLRDLEDRWVIGGTEPADVQQSRIVALSLKFGVLCRFTAFVAVDRSEVVNVGGKPQGLVQPVELPDGWAVGGAATGFASARAYAPLMTKLGAPAMPCSAPYEEQEIAELCLNDDWSEASPEDGDRNGGPHEDLQEDSTLDFNGGAELVPNQEVELTAYRQRALHILDEFRADPDVGHAVGVLAVKLQALVDDLVSIGAGEAVIEPLRHLLEEFRTAFEVGALAAKAVQVVAAWSAAK